MTRAITAFFLMLATSGTALAEEPVCMSAGEMRATLIEMYGEYPQPGVIKTSTSVTQLWASATSGTWTLVKYLVDGTACAIDEGSDMETAPVLASAASRTPGG